MGWCYDCCCCLCHCVIKLVILSEKEFLSMRALCIVRSSVGCKDQPCSWMHREGRDNEEKREDLLAESEENNYMLHLKIL
jgi:hypothetical protein